MGMVKTFVVMAVKFNFLQICISENMCKVGSLFK